MLSRKPIVIVLALATCMGACSSTSEVNSDPVNSEGSTVEMTPYTDSADVDSTFGSTGDDSDVFTGEVSEDGASSFEDYTGEMESSSDVSTDESTEVVTDWISDESPSTSPLPDNVRFVVQEGWVENMNEQDSVAFSLPCPEGTHADASVVVTHDPDNGSTPKQVVQGWRRQFTNRADSKASARVGMASRDGMTFYMADLSGTYIGDAATGQVDESPNHRMLGTIVETSEGPLYVTLSGSRESVAEWAASYRRFVQSVSVKAN